MARRGANDDERSDLRLRVLNLESRVRSLERLLAPRRPVAPAKPSPTVRSTLRTCPGCLLELPAGKRGKACVWCGFRFDAVAPIPARRRPGKRL